MNYTLLYNATIVTEKNIFRGGVLIDDDKIADIFKEDTLLPSNENIKKIDLQGALLLPGMIDTHVHFRTPGLTHKATIRSESRAAAKGGITSFLDMPNTIPQTKNQTCINEKITIAQTDSLINYGFFVGATNHNFQELLDIDATLCAGVKIYMGSSTGNMLVDREDMLHNIFREIRLPIMVHCEDENIIRNNIDKYKDNYPTPPNLHALIRSKEACVASTKFAVKLAKQHHHSLHIAHISTAEELHFLSKTEGITGEVCIPHLCFTEQDYQQLGNKIKCNPSIKSEQDCLGLRQAVGNGIITTIATDHAPHLLSEKNNDYFSAPSGIPSIQHALEVALSLFPPLVAAEKTAHQPAILFGISQRGFIKKGYYADLVVVRQQEHRILQENLLSLCKWSPWIGKTMNYKVETTFVNGQKIYDKGSIIETCASLPLLFSH